MRFICTCVISLLLCLSHITAQNLPSLILNRNINATFSIIGYDPQAREWGIAVATNNIYVGNSTCYLQPGIGAFSVIAETDPAYGLNGLQQLKQGASVEQAIDDTRLHDSLADYRQVSGIDAQGNAWAFTGSSLRYWKGTAAHHTGRYYAVMGNQLSPGTLSAMATTFEQSTGTLAERLLQSLIAGEKAGGQITGKQSAALVVKGINNEWFNQIDLRVDHSHDPFAGLQRLLHYHYGRISINQAIYAISSNNSTRGLQLLQQGEQLTHGWYGIYPNVAKAYLLLNRPADAIRLILAAIKGEPRWKENLSAFYCLYNYPVIRNLYPENRFTTADWNNAISMLTDLHQTQKAITLAHKTLHKTPTSSYTWYLLAQAWIQQGNADNARQANNNALLYDTANADAIRLQHQLQ